MSSVVSGGGPGSFGMVPAVAASAMTGLIVAAVVQLAFGFLPDGFMPYLLAPAFFFSGWVLLRRLSRGFSVARSGLFGVLAVFGVAVCALSPLGAHVLFGLTARLVPGSGALGVLRLFAGGWETTVLGILEVWVVMAVSFLAPFFIVRALGGRPSRATFGKTLRFYCVTGAIACLPRLLGAAFS